MRIGKKVLVFVLLIITGLLMIVILPVGAAMEVGSRGLDAVRARRKQRWPGRPRAPEPPPFSVTGTILMADPSIYPEWVIFRGLSADDYGVLEGRRSILTIQADDREEYSAFFDIDRYPLERGDRVTLTFKSGRLRAIGMTWLLVTDMAPAGPAPRYRSSATDRSRVRL